MLRMTDLLPVRAARPDQQPWGHSRHHRALKEKNMTRVQGQAFLQRLKKIGSGGGGGATRWFTSLHITCYLLNARHPTCLDANQLMLSRRTDGVQQHPSLCCACHTSQQTTRGAGELLQQPEGAPCNSFASACDVCCLHAPFPYSLQSLADYPSVHIAQQRQPEMLNRPDH